MKVFVGLSLPVLISQIEKKAQTEWPNLSPFFCTKKMPPTYYRILFTHELA